MAEGGDDDLAPLRVLLAKAFQRLGEYEEAQRWYRFAQQKLEQTDDLNADILVGLAQIELAVSDDIRAALENFAIAESEYPSADAYLEALLGRADCEARVGSHPEAIEHFGQAVGIVADNFHRSKEKQELVITPIHMHFEFSAEKDDFKRALDYLSLLKPLYRHEEMPPQLLLEFAAMHEQIAKKQLEIFSDSEEPSILSDELVHIDTSPPDAGGRTFGDARSRNSLCPVPVIIISSMPTLSPGSTTMVLVEACGMQR